MAVITLEQQASISEGDTDVASIDYTPYLDADELLTGTPTAAEQTTSDLTLSNVAVSTAVTEIMGTNVVIGKAVQFSVTGQQSGTRYRIRITASTDASIARTKVVDIILNCI